MNDEGKPPNQPAESPPSQPVSRRQFLKLAAAAGLLTAIRPKEVLDQLSSPPDQEPPPLEETKEETKIYLPFVTKEYWQPTEVRCQTYGELLNHLLQRDAQAGINQATMTESQIWQARNRARSNDNQRHMVWIVSDLAAANIKNNPDKHGTGNVVEWIKAQALAHNDKAREIGLAGSAIVDEVILVPPGVVESWRVDRLPSEGERNLVYHNRQHSFGLNKPAPQPFNVDIMVVMSDEFGRAGYPDGQSGGSSWYYVEGLGKEIKIEWGNALHEWFAHLCAAFQRPPEIGVPRSTGFPDWYWANGCFDEEKRLSVFEEPSDFMSSPLVTWWYGQPAKYGGLSALYADNFIRHCSLPRHDPYFGIQQDGVTYVVDPHNPVERIEPTIAFARGYLFNIYGPDGELWSTPDYLEPKGKLVYEMSEPPKYDSFNVFRNGRLLLDKNSGRPGWSHPFEISIWQAIYQFKNGFQLPFPRHGLNSLAWLNSYNNPMQVLSADIRFHRNPEPHWQNDFFIYLHWIKGNVRINQDIIATCHLGGDYTLVWSSQCWNPSVGVTSREATQERLTRADRARFIQRIQDFKNNQKERQRFSGLP